MTDIINGTPKDDLWKVYSTTAHLMLLSSHLLG